MQGVEKTFHLTRSDKDLLAKQEYDIQVGECIKFSYFSKLLMC